MNVKWNFGTGMSNFVHLHLHAEYSLLDGAARISLLPKRAKELGMNAFTDGPRCHAWNLGFLQAV